MPDDEGEIALPDADGDEGDGERQSRHDLRVDDGDLIDAVHEGARAALGIEHPDGARRSQHGGKRRGNERQNDGVADHFEDGGVAEELCVVFEGELAHGAEGIHLVEAVHGKEQDGGVKKEQDEPHIEGF